MICDACGQKNEAHSNFCVVCGTYLLMDINVLKLTVEELQQRLWDAEQRLPTYMDAPIILGTKSKEIREAGLTGLADGLDHAFKLGPGDHKTTSTDITISEVKELFGGHLAIVSFKTWDNHEYQLPIYAKEERVVEAFRQIIASVLGYSMSSLLRGVDVPLDINGKVYT